MKVQEQKHEPFTWMGRTAHDLQNAVAFARTEMTDGEILEAVKVEIKRLKDSENV